MIFCIYFAGNKGFHDNDACVDVDGACVAMMTLSDHAVDGAAREEPE